jgi:hypothetical protein
MLRLYTTVVRSKLQHASVVWNSITSTDANKLERIKQRFSALCFNRLFAEAHCCYSLALEELNFHSLHEEASPLNQVYSGLKFRPSVLETVGLPVPARYIGDSALFSVCSKCKGCSSARRATAACVVMTLTYSQPGTFFLISYVLQLLFVELNYSY